MGDSPAARAAARGRWLRLSVLSVATFGAVVLGLLWSVGANLPAEHQHRVGITLKQGPSAVWSQLVAWNEQSAWRTDVDTIEELPEVGGRASWRLHSPRGGTSRESVLALNAPHSFTLRIEGRGYAGTRTVQLVRDGLGTAIVVSERGEVQAPLRRLVWRRSGLEAPARRYLQDLAIALGEEKAPFTDPGDLAQLGP